jgi:SAM-dependent methyltransferase
MCGTGETTGYLIEKGARVTGLDISDAAVEIFKKKWPGCEGKCTSIFENNLTSGSFDIAVVIFGFHHVHPDIDKAFSEIHRVLKKGGLLCFVEPYEESVQDVFRRSWYKHDRMFAENEKAIDLKGLRKKWAPYFKFTEEHYGGGIAYLLVYNSMIFRIPHSIKRYYSELLFVLENIFRRLQGKLFSGFVICQWEKN